MQFTSLSDIIRKAQKKYPAFSKRLAEAEALGRWELAVGPQIAKHSRAVRVYNSVLFIEVFHPIWKSELHYRRRQILDILNGKSRCATPGFQPLPESVSDLYLIDSSRSRF